MIRLVLLLCGGLYVTAMVLGADHGQKRHGLMMADSQPAPAAPVKQRAEQDLFIPAQPVMQAPALPASALPTPALPASALPASALPTPALPTPALPDTTAQAAPAVQAVTDLPAAPPALLTAAETVSLPALEISGGILYTVTANQANVRGGPGRNFAVVGSVTHGEQVLVVVEEQPLRGWSRIRIEGDGIEGYVSTRLLTRSE